MSDEIMVSICCITYNHEKYIRDALDGFIQQKVNFKYEIIIHDDASTDNTVNIIEEYKREYPDLIKTIYQKENQYKKGKKTSLIAFSKAIGKYIAVCEGDDYWIDLNKLQKQIDYMENNEKCTLCFHDAKIIYMKTKKEERFFNYKRICKKFVARDDNYDASNIHLFGLGEAPTASFVFRRKCIENIPQWFYDAPCGDLPLKLLTTSFGYAHFINEEMSVYRKETGNSVTDQWINEHKRDVEKKIIHIDKVKKVIEDFDQYTEFNYSKGLLISKKIYDVQKKLINKDFKDIILNKDLKVYYKIKYKDPFCFKLFLKHFFSKWGIIIKKYCRR